jgi:flagellar hook-associated protein 1 FlgK
MSSILTSLLNSTGALQAYNRVFSVIQNNITNANTPGYVKQDQVLLSLPFQPNGGPQGGVVAGALLSARSPYLEQAVRQGQSQLGTAQQKTTDLTQIQTLFPLTDNSGISDAMNQFFGSASQLSVNPSDPVLRQQLITQAGNVAQQFNQVATGIQQATANVDQSTRDTVAKINSLADQIGQVNVQNQTNGPNAHDAGVDAQLYSSLEDLSSSANVSVIQANDGTFNLYIGQTPLVVGNTVNHISVDFSSQQTTIRDKDGADITSQITGGTLAGQIQDKNTTLPGYTASLNTLAQTFADQVNTTLAQGVDQSGQPPTVNLFTYNQASDAASTIKITNITPDQIAAASVGAQGGGGNALALNQLANAPTINGGTFTQAYGNLGAQVGFDLSAAQNDQTRYQDVVTQAQAQRSATTGVDLNEEAARLLQFQQAYSAVGKLVSVLDSISQTVLDMIH